MTVSVRPLVALLGLAGSCAFLDSSVRTDTLVTVTFAITADFGQLQQFELGADQLRIRDTDKRPRCRQVEASWARETEG